MLDFKIAEPTLDIKALDEKGQIEGYASTFEGEPDASGDVIAVGAFVDSIAEHERRKTTPKMFWQHDRNQPIGKWLDFKEDDFGLWVKGQLNMSVRQAQEAHALLIAGDIDGLSIGYRIREYSVDTETGIWTLEKVDLCEISVVSIGANENATVSNVKAARASYELVERLKAGDRLTEREFETLLKGTLGFSNSEAERAARICLKGRGEPAKAEKDLKVFLEAMTQ